jgi:hypothetical protein
LIHRVDPQFASDERTTLVEFLTYFRDTLELKASGLTDEQARTASVPPSDLTLMGLVRHMADVERSWFQRVLAGRDGAIEPDAAPIYYGASHPTGDADGDLHPGPDDTLSEGVETWRREIARSDTVMADLPLDHLAKGGTWDGTDGPPNLRWILVHLIEEYARHCGHADLLRQAIDGSVGD